MRIISGTHKGIKLNIPKLTIRPTTDKNKEAIFNILNNKYLFEDKNVLDLFSGSGNIAYEFASRGCEHIIAVDKNPKCINYINIQSNIFGFNIKTVKDDSLNYIKKTNLKFNFIFIDPPYNYQKYQQLKDLIIKKELVKNNGCLIFEHDRKTKIKGENIQIREYGGTCFSILSF
tara:strand:- start:362 stop:883 length:522 start_codon:yes stop_codon:yes gene_type:complete